MTRILVALVDAVARPLTWALDHVDPARFVDRLTGEDD